MSAPSSAELRQQVFARPPRRLVAKVGSNVLSRPGGGLDTERIVILARQIADARQRGSQVILVSSGAVAAGMGLRGLKKRPTDLPELQGLAAIGQGRLMAAYTEAFAPYGILVAQVLLTRGDLEDRTRYLNAGRTLSALLDVGVLPIINENDTVVTEELTFGDNDYLSALIAGKTNSDLLIILSDIDGFYTANPNLDPNAQLIEVVERITPEIEALAGGSTSGVGRGGMVSKLTAARHAMRFGLAAVITNGRNPEALGEVLSGQFKGTLFLPTSRARTRGRARAHWIATRRPRGAVLVDDGACRALLEKGKSLLPVGVRAVEGAFQRGDVIAVLDGERREIALGISNFSAAEVQRIAGAHKSDLPGLLGTPVPAEEVVHRDNLLVRE